MGYIQDFCPVTADLATYEAKVAADEAQWERVDRRSDELYPRIFRETIKDSDLIADVISPEFDLRPAVAAAYAKDPTALMQAMRSLIVFAAKDTARRGADAEAENQIETEDERAEAEADEAQRSWYA